MKTIATLAACILLAASASAATPEIKVASASKPQRPAATESAKPAVAATVVYDYRLEQESCCGPLKE
jgi:hypothetical protein